MSTEFVIWGYKPGVLPEPYPIALTGGNVRHCRASKRQDWERYGWQCAIYKQGDRPVGLALQIAEQYGQPSPEFLAAIGVR